VRTRVRKPRPPETQQRSISLIPIVLDEELRFDGRPAGESVLTLPLGTRSVLAYVLAELSECRHRRTLIVSGRDAGYYALDECPEAGEVQVVAPEQLAEVISTCETSDYLMLVQPRFWPTAGHDFAFMARAAARFRGVTHVVAVGGPACAARERIVCDSDGQVRRVHRLFDEMNWPEAASSTLLCSLVPAHLLNNTAVLSPAALRTDLAARGVLTQDLPLPCDVDDLADASGLLAVNERTIGQCLQGPLPEGFRRLAPGVLAGGESWVHPSARLVGPIILQHEAVIEQDAQIIGPVLIGRRARVRRGAVVTGSLLGNGTCIPALATVSQEVVFARAHALAAGGTNQPQRPAAETLSLKGLGSFEPVDLSPGPRDRFRGAQLLAKRAIDVIGAASGLILLLPLLLIIAALVKLTSPGPVFFIHRRERKDGSEFPCIKFRSMVADAHLKQRELYKQNQVDGPQFKMERDPRETRLGRILRRTNLDELPQLINVLLGHMSLVGPRPSPFRENQICVPWRRARLSVRPGITGLWQLCRDRRDEADFHQWIYYDLAYVRNFSLWLDLKILFYTVVSLGGKRQVTLSQLIPSESSDAPASSVEAEPVSPEPDEGHGRPQ
jgi:lipopolysaccharide/colanic/teichoic acid biosynthesis glycosyltransferase